MDSQLLTKRQLRRLRGLPVHHELVTTRGGRPIVRGPRGQLLAVKPNGRMEGVVEKVRSYLHVEG